MQRILLAIVVCFMTSQIVTINCYSVDPDEFLQNPKKELRARNISKNVRCLVCQNQSIDESSAPLAKDLRILIRKKIKQGNSDEEIYNFLTERYGDFILLNPLFKISTLFLWILPFVFLAIGIFVIFLHNNKSKKLNYSK
jgi:cytochrome c-type biogenesis protein CcmH